MDFDISKRWFYIILFTFFCFSGLSYAENLEIDQLTDLSFDELMQVEIKPVSRRGQELNDAAAAAFVITQADIKRSGAANIPELLRMVPGIIVKQLGSRKWAVGARSTSGEMHNRLLVLADGRNLYSPVADAVYWDHVDFVMEDIERIEVIRGPGASLWGANAVDGVVNIITKSAEQTQGGYGKSQVTDDGSQAVALRYGFELNPNLYTRAYFKYSQDAALLFSSGEEFDNNSRVIQSGIRLDGSLSNGQRYTIKGDVFQSDLGQRVRLPYLNMPYYQELNDKAESSGWNILGRWIWPTTNRHVETDIQLYFDHFERQELGYVSQNTQTFDFDLQRKRIYLGRHTFMWGLGFRQSEIRMKNFEYEYFPEPSINTQRWSFFVQNEFSLIENVLGLTIGSKFESEDLTGAESQPTVRFLWHPNANSSLWGAVSRAIRTPSLTEKYGSTTLLILPPTENSPLPTELQLLGNPDQTPEELISYELGWRYKAEGSWSYDVTVFYSDFNKVRSVDGTQEVAVTIAPDNNFLIATEVLDNESHAVGQGLELATEWQVAEYWKLLFAYSHTEIDIESMGNTFGDTNRYLERMLPDQQFSLRSMLDIHTSTRVDVWLRYVSSTELYNPEILRGIDEEYPAYWDLDISLSHQVNANATISIGGHNLLSKTRAEGNTARYKIADSQITRAVYASLEADF